MKKSIQKGGVRKDAYKENLESYHRSQRDIQTMKNLYPLFRNEREEVQKFIEDQLRKKYIRPSKSPQMLLVFFVGKKNGNKRIL